MESTLSVMCVCVPVPSLKLLITTHVNWSYINNTHNTHTCTHTCARAYTHTNLMGKLISRSKVGWHALSLNSYVGLSFTIGILVQKFYYWGLRYWNINPLNLIIYIALCHMTSSWHHCMLNNNSSQCTVVYITTRVLGNMYCII